MARLGDKDVEDAVLEIECDEAAWEAMMNGGLMRRARRLGRRRESFGHG